MNVRRKSWLGWRALTFALLSGPVTALLTAGEPIQFSGPKTKIELPSGRETRLPTTISIDLEPSPSQPGPGPRVPVMSSPQLSLRDQMRIKEFIHEQQNWMFYDPHILSGKSALDQKSSLPLTSLELGPAPRSSTMQMLFGKPSDSSRPVIPMVRPASESDFKSDRKSFQDPIAWPAGQIPIAPQYGDKAGRPYSSGGSSTAGSSDRPESTFFDLLNPGGRGGGSRDQLSRRAAFNELLTPPTAPASGVASGLGGVNFSTDTTRLPFNSGSGLSRELPTASRLGSVLDPMRSFTPGSHGLRGSIFDDPNARYSSVTPAPATAARQVESLKMIKSPVVTEFPVRKF